MNCEVVYTDKAPEPIGPYSQAIKVNGFIFISGCLPFCPKEKRLISGNIHDEARQALLNLQNILKAGGSDIDKLVKVTIFLREMSIFKDLNEVYKEFIKAPFPARTTVAVKELPLSASMEIEAIATYK